MFDALPRGVPIVADRRSHTGQLVRRNPHANPATSDHNSPSDLGALNSPDDELRVIHVNVVLDFAIRPEIGHRVAAPTYRLEHSAAKREAGVVRSDRDN